MARILEFSHKANWFSSLSNVETLGWLSDQRAIVDPKTPVASHKSFCDLPIDNSLLLITLRNFSILSAYNRRLSCFMFTPIAFMQKYMLTNYINYMSIVAQTQSIVNDKG